MVYLNGLNGSVSHDWWAVGSKTDGLPEESDSAYLEAFFHAKYEN